MARVPTNDRPALARWLILARASQDTPEQRYTVERLLADLKAETGWAPVRATYAQWESGAVTPHESTLAPVIAFWKARGVPGPGEVPVSSPDPLAAAINRQAAAIEANTTAVRELIELLAPLAVRGIALGAAEAAEVLRRVEGSQSA